MFFLSFQSTHSRGVRLSVAIVTYHLICFNPRTHEECDFDAETSALEKRLVSIHALTRSATCVRNTPHFLALFQSTHSRGVRRSGQTTELILSVSIHALTRSATADVLEHAAFTEVSIHALTRSATLFLKPMEPHKVVSIHALTRSATRHL